MDSVKQDVIEITLKTAQKQVDIANAYDKIARTDEWDLLITQGYYIDEAARLTSNLDSDNEHISNEDMIISLRAIAAFRKYLDALAQRGAMCERTIADTNEYIQDSESDEEHY